MHESVSALKKPDRQSGPRQTKSKPEVQNPKQ